MPQFKQKKGEKYIFEDFYSSENGDIESYIEYDGKQRRLYTSKETITAENDGNILVRLKCRVGTTTNFTIKPFVYTGEIEVPYEPYTGGQPSPNPDYPQEIVSAGKVGDVNVTVRGKGDIKDSQIISIDTPTGLPAIPVSSGGNYTDASGQQWVADYIDLARGKYVQRVWKGEFGGSDDEDWRIYSGDKGYEGFWINTLPEIMQNRSGFCNSLRIKKEYDKGIEGIWIGSPFKGNKILYCKNSRFFDATLSDKGLSNWKDYLAEWC